MSDLVTHLIGESLLMTALLIAAVLVLRRPVAALFGPRIAYALWIIPALRLILPPLPGGEVVIAAPIVPVAPIDMMALDASVTTAGPVLWLESLLTIAVPVWIIGAVAVLAIALLRHRRWVRALHQSGTALDPIDGTQVVMSDSVNGPVAIGLRQPMIAVPTDFFVRYSRAEREMAIAHELAHHRAGDLWANAAALAVLAAQWFNPLAWLAVHAFRFDQEAACDARVLSGLAPDRANHQAHSYACAIAKSVAGPRLLLAAPMTSGKKVKERLQMLTLNPRLGTRPAIGRLLLGTATLSALALTVSTLPAREVYAAEPAAPSVADAPPPPGAPVVEKQKMHQVMILDASADGAKDADGTKRKMHHIVLSSEGEGGSADMPRVMMFDGKDGANVDVKMAPSIRMHRMSHNHDDLRATLKEQGIADAKIDTIIKQLDEKRAKAAPRAISWSAHSDASVVTKCKDGDNPRVMIDRNSEISGGKSVVRMVQCGGAALSRDKQIEAMKKARDRFTAQKGDIGVSAEIRASVLADLEKSIAELEKAPK